VPSFVLFAVRSHLRSLPVVFFLVLVGWDAAVYLAADIWTWIKSWFIYVDPELPDLHIKTLSHYVLSYYSAAPSDFLIFLACLAFARFLVLLWQQNVELGRRLLKYGWIDLLKTYLWPAFALWWPMLSVFLAFGVIGYPQLTDLIAGQIAAAIQDDLIGPESEKKYAPAKEPSPPELEPMIRHLIEYSRITLIAESKSKIDGLELWAVTTTDELNTVVFNKLEKDIFPPRLPGTHTTGCGVKIPCLAANGVKSAANSGYRRLRDPPLAKTKQTLERLHAEARGNGAVFAQSGKAAIEHEIELFAARTGVAFDKALYAGRSFSLIMLIYSIIATVAMANKTARTGWAIMARGEAYRAGHRPALTA
jgi:hypothetical protein